MDHRSKQPRIPRRDTKMVNQEIQKLKLEIQRLQQKQNEEEELKQLKQIKKELEEKGTVKSKIKEKMKTAYKHLQEKGKQYREEKTDEGMFKKPQFGTGFGTNQEYYNQPFQSPITKQIMNKKKKNN